MKGRSDIVLARVATTTGIELTSALETEADAMKGVWLGFAHDREGFSLCARLGLAGTAPSRDSAGGSIAAIAAFVIDLPDALYLRLEGSAMLWLVDRHETSNAASTSRVTPIFAPRLELGIGWHL